MSNPHKELIKNREQEGPIIVYNPLAVERMCIMEDGEKKPVIERPMLDGVQKIFKFANGYGASVVKHTGSYGYSEGNWELAVVYFPNDNPEEFSLTYDTYITSDVVGHLTWQEVYDYLIKIHDLPARKDINRGSPEGPNVHDVI